MRTTSWEQWRSFWIYNNRIIIRWEANWTAHLLRAEIDKHGLVMPPTTEKRSAVLKLLISNSSFTFNRWGSSIRWIPGSGSHKIHTRTPYRIFGPVYRTWGSPHQRYAASLSLTLQQPALYSAVATPRSSRKERTAPISANQWKTIGS